MPRTDEKNIGHSKFVKPIYHKNSEKISCGVVEARKKSSTFKNAPPPPSPPPPHQNEMVRYLDLT
jgi:hypothetical protein